MIVADDGSPLAFQARLARCSTASVTYIRDGQRAKQHGPAWRRTAACVVCVETTEAGVRPQQWPPSVCKRRKNIAITYTRRLR